MNPGRIPVSLFRSEVNSATDKDGKENSPYLDASSSFQMPFASLKTAHPFGHAMILRVLKVIGQRGIPQEA